MLGLHSHGVCDGRVGALSCFAFIESVARGYGVWYRLGLFIVGPANIFIDRTVVVGGDNRPVVLRGL